MATEMRGARRHPLIRRQLFAVSTQDAFLCCLLLWIDESARIFNSSPICATHNPVLDSNIYLSSLFCDFFHEFFESSSSTVSSSFLENGFFSVKYFVVIKFLQTKMISSAKRATDQRQQQKPFPCFLGQQRRQQRTQIIFHMHTLDDYLLPFWCGLIRRQAQTFLFFKIEKTVWRETNN